MSNLIIAETVISQDIHGRYRLNDLHAASPEVGNKNKSPWYWMQLESTQVLIERLDAQTQISGFGAIDKVRGGSSPGTYACEELTIAYAAWINPDFHIHVIQSPRSPER